MPAGTLVNALIRHCGASLSGIGGVKRPGIVHRLDKDTSGLLVVAKTDTAHRGLADLFADHGRTGSLEREYLALVWGGFEASAGKVDAPLGRDSRNREKMAVVSEERGRQATTHWRLEEQLGPASPDRMSSLRPGGPIRSGSTWPRSVIRCSVIRCMDLGSRPRRPCLGDRAVSALAALGRQALHAAVLGFDHPTTGETLRFERPPPKDFARLLKALRVTATA